jgi:hypothetical protein
MQIESGLMHPGQVPIKAAAERIALVSKAGHKRKDCGEAQRFTLVSSRFGAVDEGGEQVFGEEEAGFFESEAAIMIAVNRVVATFDA